MQNTRTVLLAFLGAAISVASLHATTYYVSPSGSDSADGLTRETALKDVTSAIKRADTDDIVFMLNGTHVFTNRGEIIFPKRITLCGEDRDLTILDNENKGGMIKSQNASAGTIYHSFTLTRFGSSYSGSLGITTSGTSAFKTVVSNMVFRQNGNTFNGNARYPLQVLAGGHISYCYITNNIAPNNAGVQISGATVMENCYIADNAAKGDNANWPGIVQISSDSCVFRNNTVVNNKSDKGVIFLNSSSPKVYNNIIWGNTSYTSPAENNVNTNGKSTDNFKGNCTRPLVGTRENGNTDTDPLLGEDNKHFSRASVCNGGAFAYAEENWAPEFDIEYATRPQPPSIGAYEYVASSKLSVKVKISSTTAFYPGTITVSAEPDGQYKAPLTYAWDLDGDGVTDSTEEAPVLSDIAVYTPTVTITDADSKTATDTLATPLVIYSADGKVYVTSSENPNAKPPYATPETAATKLTDAITYALIGSVIELDDGIHYIESTVSLSRDYTVKSKNGPDVTFLAKRSGEHQLFNLLSEGAVLDGFTVQEQSFKNYSVGAAIAAESGTVRNCRFIRNKVLGHGQVSSSTTIQNSTVLFENLIFIGNTSDTQGPAGMKFNGKTTARNCLFLANTNKITTATDTGYWGGGAIYVSHSGSLIENCTIVSNVSWNAGDAGIHGSCWTRNTITAFNLQKSGSEYIPSDAISTNRISYSCVYPSATDFSLCEGMVTKDPLFVNQAEGNLHLRRFSPCVNAGTNIAYTAESKDLEGNPRIHDFGMKHSNVDLGCYEGPYTFVNGLKLLVK